MSTQESEAEYYARRAAEEEALQASHLEAIQAKTIESAKAYLAQQGFTEFAEADIMAALRQLGLTAEDLPQEPSASEES